MGSFKQEEQVVDVVTRARRAIFHLEKFFQIPQRVGHVAEEEEFLAHCRTCIEQGTLDIFDKTADLRDRYRESLFRMARTILRKEAKEDEVISFRDHLAWPALVSARTPKWQDTLFILPEDRNARDSGLKHGPALFAIDLAIRGLCLVSARVAAAFLADYRRVRTH